MSDVVNVNTGYDINRHHMPQIAGKDIPAFLKYLDKNQIPYEQITKKVFELKPTQKELNVDKIKHLMQQDLEDLNATPFIISKGDRILDGHHRWAAIQQKDGDYDVAVIRVGLPMQSLINYGNKFSKSFNKSIDELKLTNILQTVIEGKSTC